jgi:hypothetical protein
MCTHPIDPIGIHLLHCTHGNEHTRTHDVICDIIAAIVQDAGFHMGQKQLHTFPSATFNYFCWQIDIALTKDGICTLVDVVLSLSTQRLRIYFLDLA